jgi:hypothetical protein
MRVQRVREAHAPEALERIYAQPHKSALWADHRLRVAVTIQLAEAIGGPAKPATVADLSCGDAVIARAVAPYALAHLGDYAPGYRYQGPIEKTIGEIPAVDLFICTETIEHLDQPDAVLGQIRRQARALVLSTPLEAWDDANLEHYWAWDREAVEDMLTSAGWRVDVFASLDCRPAGGEYNYGIWGCR